MVDELSGILNWALEGCRRWQEQGLKEPDGIINAGCQYRARPRHKSIQQYLEDYTIAGGWTSSKELYDVYVLWANHNNINPLSHIEFGKQLKAQGIESSIKSNQRGYKNISLA